MPRVFYSKCPIHQADAVLSQANPVSTTLYTVLNTQKNVRIISIMNQITWATTQPTPLEIVVTIDGQTIIFAKANPVTATAYFPWFIDEDLPANQQMQNVRPSVGRPFLLEGRSIKIETRITWATTQPTPLQARVKWAKIP